MAFLGSIEYLIPTTRTTPQIARNIASIADDSVGADSKVSIHFDGTEDTQSTWIHKIADEGMVTVTAWSDSVNRGPAASRNFLANNSTADLLVFVDSDVLLAKHFDRNLRSLLSIIRENVVLYPRIRGASESAASEFFDRFVLAPRVGAEWVYLTSATFALSRATWKNTGGFNEDFKQAAGEDYEFFSRIQRKNLGIDVIVDTTLHASHQNPVNIRALRKRAERYRAAHVRMRFGNAKPFRNRTQRALHALNVVLSLPGRHHNLYFLARGLIIVRDLSVRIIRIVRPRPERINFQDTRTLFFEKLKPPMADSTRAQVNSMPRPRFRTALRGLTLVKRVKVLTLYYLWKHWMRSPVGPETQTH